MDNYTLINKKIVLSSKALISVKERACRFGDGVFESLKIVNGKIYDYKSHENRLIRGLKALKINADISDLEKDSCKLIAENKIKNGMLRIAISRGNGSMGYLPKDGILPLIIIETAQEIKIISKRIKLGISKVRLLKRPLFLQKCKTMQSLQYILAKISSKQTGHFDDIMLSQRGFIGECSSSNIFWIKNNKIYTPSLKCDILPGTIRNKILRKFKVNAVETKVERLKEADEVFLTNSNFLVIAIDEIIFKDQKVKYKKEFSKRILDFINKDIEKKCH